jgi:hypothetical protein
MKVASGFMATNLTSALAIPALFLSMPASAQTQQDTQLWTAVTVNGKLTDTLVYAADGQFRLFDGLSRYGHTVLRGSIGIRVVPDLTISVGYAHSNSNRVGQAWLAEDRAFEQFNWTIVQRSGVGLTTRGRLEERWLEVTRQGGAIASLFDCPCPLAIMPRPLSSQRKASSISTRQIGVSGPALINIAA